MSSGHTGRPGLSSITVLFASLLLCGVLLALTVVPAVAKRAPQRDGALAAQPVAEREIEQAGPIRTAGDAQEQYGIETGVLRRYWRRASGVPDDAGSPSDAALATARRFLEENAPRLGLVAARLDEDLELFSEKRSPSGTHIRWQQVVAGVPVHRAEIVVKVSNTGVVSSVQNNLRPNVRIETAPAIDAAQAVAIGVDAVRPTGKALGPYRADLRVFEADTGARLAYIVSVPVEEPLGDWVVYVDAASGAVFGLEDQALYVNGTGRVFDPDPETKTGNPNLPDGNDSDAGIPFPAAYDTRTLRDITQNGSVFSLTGPFVKIIDFESPAIAPYTATNADSFQLTRSPNGFEDVNVYFQLDNNQRYIQSLGFLNINNRVQEVDVHGLSGADNSHYIPSNKRIAFGDGGVDDAEDADVVIHEYGHSIQDNIVPGWGGGQEGAMGEGFGDYWGGSYSRSLYPTYQPTFFFNWDGHNEFWSGRLLIDSTMHYPEDCCGQVHESGTLWCSGLWNALLVIGRPVMDRLVLDHHFALGTSATMADAANQIIQSDIDLYGGAHLSDIVRIFGFWGFVDPNDFAPIIAHTPLSDTENTTGPYGVVATITSAQPLEPTAVRVEWGIGAFTNSIQMTATGNPNEYAASIPGPLSEVDVRYYISAGTTGGVTATDPAGAPAAFHEFRVGADLIPPEIAHAPIGDSPWRFWPNVVRGTVTDNIAVDPESVRVDWELNKSPQPSFYLGRVGATDLYEGAFPSDTASVSIGDEIRYSITARDLAASPNARTVPPTGAFTFDLIDVYASVLVLDDDELPRGDGTKIVPDETRKGAFVVESEGERAAADVGKSASSIAQALIGAGFAASVEPAGTSNPAGWPDYDFLVSSSGANTAPVSNAAYRAALESYVAAGGKLLVEGGEVVFDAASSPGYPTFAANVLHTNDWDADNGGALTLLPARTNHPIATAPNALPATMAINYASSGHEDSYKPLAPAYIVYGVTAQSGNGGILVFDDNASPVSAQVVVFGFDYKAVADAAARSALLENTARFLIAYEGAPTGSISGAVFLAGQSNHSGVIVVANPGGARDTTGADGAYRLANLYGTTYTVTASKPGWSTGTAAGVVVAEGVETPNVNFGLVPLADVQYCLSPSLVIPDNNPVGVTSTITVPDTFLVEDVEVTVNITHTWRGDLIVELRHGGTTVRLHNQTGGSADNIIGTYPTTLVVDGPGALSDFDGASAGGAWTLFISDNASQDVGRLNSWCVRLKGPTFNPTGVEEGSAAPPAHALLQSQPNPARGGATTIRFALPRDGRVSLGVFDVSGRLVRVLIDGALPAGLHAAPWDGRDDAGREVAAGVYLYRLETERFLGTRKLVVLR